MTLAQELQEVTKSFGQQAPTEVLEVMGEANTKLAESKLLDGVLKPGSKIPDFDLPDATGKIISSKELRANNLLLISFYRGHWCPYCNLELNALQARLSEITAKGAILVAISPQTPDQSLTTQEKNNLEFPVLSDVGNKVAKQFGLVFTLDESLRPIYQSFGIDLTAHNGDSSFELPVPATYLVARDGTVIESYVNTNYSERLEPETAIAWLDSLNN